MILPLMQTNYYRKNKTEHFPHIVRGPRKEKINRDITFHHGDWKSVKRLDARLSDAAKLWTGLIGETGSLV